MAEGSESVDAETNNLQGLKPEIREPLDNRADSESLQLLGAVCRFEQVRGTGQRPQLRPPAPCDGELAPVAEIQSGSKVLATC